MYNLPLSEMCPKAFDVLTTDANTPRRAIQLIVSKEGGNLEGAVELSFNNASILLDANPNNLSSEECTAQVSKMKGVAKATCTTEHSGGEALSAYRYTISFTEWSLVPYENNWFVHDGNPPLEAFSCNMNRVNEFKAVNPHCEVVDVFTEGSPGVPTEAPPSPPPSPSKTIFHTSLFVTMPFMIVIPLSI